MALDLGPLPGGGGVLQGQRVQREHHAELLELLRGGLVQAQPDEAVAVPGGVDGAGEVADLGPVPFAVVSPVDGRVEQAVGARRGLLVGPRVGFTGAVAQYGVDVAQGSPGQRQ